MCLRPCVEECYDTVYCGYEQQTGINDTNQNEFNRKVQSLHDETYIYMHTYLLFYLTEIYIVVYCIYTFIDGAGKFYYNNVSSVMTRCIADTNNRQVLTIQTKMNVIGKYNHCMTKRIYIYICIHIYFT